MVLHREQPGIGSGLAAQSAVDTSFWAELQRLKLGELRLSERPVPLQGEHDPGSGPVTGHDPGGGARQACCLPSGQWLPAMM